MRRLTAALAMVLALASTASAADGRSISLVPTRTAYLTDTSVGIGPSSMEAVDFTALPGINSAVGAMSVCIENNDATNSLMFQLIPTSTAVAATLLTTPANATLSQVQVLGPAAAAEPVPCFDGNFAGIIWQSKTVAVSATVRIAY